MAKQTISVVTYSDTESNKTGDLEGSARKAISTAPNWGDETGAVRGLPIQPAGRKALVRLDIPIETLERELQELIGVMDRVFSLADQSSGAESFAEPPLLETSQNKKLKLTEISVAVEINAKGCLSILGSGGEIGGTGGITLKFVKE